MTMPAKGADAPAGVVMRHRRPLLVYHGTRRRFDTFSDAWWEPGEEGFFFTPRLAYARRFAGRTGRVIAAHLLMDRPYEVTERQWGDGHGLGLAEARAAGYDGYVVRPYCDGTMWIVFDPSRIVVLTPDLDRQPLLRGTPS